MEEHKISLSTAILLNMNIMIGSGILIGPGAAAAISGNASFLAWPIVALMFLPIVLSTIELSRLFPGAGGFYLYAKQGLNETAGFASGWMYIVGYTFAATVELLALQDILLQKFGPNIITSNPIIFNAITISAVLAFSLLSLKIVSNFLNSLTIVKILPLVILIALLPFILNPSFTITGNELRLLPASLTLPIFGYFGFEYCVGISHLIKNSEKNAPRAILIGFLGTGLLYMLFHFGVLNLMGAGNLATIGAANFPEFITLPIPYLKTLLTILIPTAAIIIFIASLIGMINANAIQLQSMAQQNLFKGGSLITPVTSHGRPWAALALQGIVVFLFACMIPTIDRAGGLCIFGVFSSFVLPFISLLIVQKRRNHFSKLPITILGLIFLLGFCTYSFTKLGTTLTECFIYSLVLLAAFAIGMILFNRKQAAH
jgi:APA family basic amino acid/polyamine antiporter